MRRRLLVGLAVVVGLTVAQRAEAATLTFNYDFAFSGAAPGGTEPWLSATFADTGANQVTLTMSTANLVDEEFASVWYFNFNPALSLANLAITESDTSDVGTTNVIKDLNDLKADGTGGSYDFVFDFPPPTGQFDKKFTSGESVSYVLTYNGAGTFNANSFNFLSVPGEGSGTSYTSAIHVQGIEPNCSGWVAPSVGATGGAQEVGPCGGSSEDVENVEFVESPENVDFGPEPTTLMLLGSGLAVAGARLRRRKAAQV